MALPCGPVKEAAAALDAAALDLPAEHRDYVAARLLLDALPNPPFHLPATAAGRPVTRTIQLGQGTAAATTASLWLPTRGSRLPGILIAVGAAPPGRHDLTCWVRRTRSPLDSRKISS